MSSLTSSIPSKSAALCREVQRAQSLLDSGKYDEAREVLGRALGQTRGTGVTSSHIHWMMAIAADYLQDAEAAVTNIREALAIDPAAPPYRRSLEIIQGRLQASILEQPRDPEAEDVLKLYELLKTLGPVETNVHLRVARHLADVGRRGAAVELARAVALVANNEEAAQLLETLSSPATESGFDDSRGTSAAFNFAS